MNMKSVNYKIKSETEWEIALIILDHMRELEDGKIVVAPFHTGHLGLFPGTELQVTLIKSNLKKGCELAICPYESSKDLFNLECILKDEPGVVGKLMAAISELNINILTQESSSIDNMERHVVSLLLDWTTTKFTKKKILNYYSSGLSNVLPVNDERFLKLYQEILKRCSDDICWSSGHIAIPKIFMRYFVHRQTWKVRGCKITKVKKEGEKGYVNSIDIGESLKKRIRVHTGYEEDDKDNSCYIIFSSTESKTLRVIFPHKDSIPNLFHVGVKHKDKPGALSIIMKMVANSDFNIICGLSRKENFEVNTWEAILEYAPKEGQSGKKKSGKGKPRRVLSDCKFVEQKIEEKHNGDSEFKQNMNYFHVEIESPRYPPRTVKEKTIKLHSDEVFEEYKKIYDEPCDVKDLREKYKGYPGCHEKIRYFDCIFNAAHDPIKRSVFVSRPESAKIHSEILIKKISEILDDETGKKKYTIYRSENVAGESIVGHVIRNIKKAKIFIGIWHAENDSNYISPWLPFEYGIAKALGKKVLLLCHENIDSRIWNRIEGDLGKKRYNDLVFYEETIPNVLKKIEEYSFDLKRGASDDASDWQC